MVNYKRMVGVNIDPDPFNNIVSFLCSASVACFIVGMLLLNIYESDDRPKSNGFILIMISAACFTLMILLFLARYLYRSNVFDKLKSCLRAVGSTKMAIAEPV